MAQLVNGGQYALAEGVQHTIETLANSLFATVGDEQAELSEDDTEKAATALEGATVKAIKKLESLLGESAKKAGHLNLGSADDSVDLSAFQSLIADMAGRVR